MSKGITRPRGTWQRLPLTLIAAVTLFFTSGCSLQAPDLAVDTARELQSRLPEVRQAAAGNDYARALSLLEQLEQDVDDAASDGAMSFARYQGISSALDRVREELQGLAAAALAQQATAEEDTVDESPAAALPDSGMIAPPAAPVPLPPVSEDKEEGNPGKGNPGKGGPGSGPGNAGQSEKKKGP